MKKLITICFLLSTAFTVKAQDGKPTKEETIAFINRTTALSIGNVYLFGDITESKFTYDSYSLTGGGQAGDEILIQKDTYSGISWETLNPEWISTINDRSNGMTGCSVGFTKKIKHEEAFTGLETKIEYKNFIQIVIPKEKFESIKKACLHLSEIAKEENKDPFQN